MNRSAVVWAVVAIAAAGVAAAALSTSRRLAGRVDALAAKIERLEARAKSEPPVPAAAVDELRKELARVDEKATAAARTASAAPPSSSSAPPPVSGEELATLVDEKVEAKLKEKRGGFGEDRKLPLHDLGKELQLDAETQARVEALANGCKKEIFELIRTPRPDGSDFAAEILQSFLSGEPQKGQAALLRLFTEKVPGTDQTYAMGVASIQERARTGLQGAMGDAVYTQYRRMGVNPENIETGFDPWAEYVKEKGLLR